MKIPPLGNAILWSLAAVYAIARLLQVVPGVPLLLLVALHVVPPLLFAIVHGSFVYRSRGILVYCALSFTIGNFFENLSIVTGFPFGHYYFTGVMGPKLFLVPLALGIAYLGIGYLAWTIGRVLAGPRLFLAPAIATLAMTAWDLSMEPVWSTVLHCWIWLGGGPYFGVPLTNFLGWCLTNYVIYLSFAVYLARGAAPPPSPNRAAWQLAVIVYAVCAAGNMLVVFAPPPTPVVTDAAGVSWGVSAITHACALASLLAMAPFAVLAWRGPRRNRSHSVDGF